MTASTTPPLHPSRQQWWQSSVIRRSRSFVEKDLAHVVSASPFLQAPPVRAMAALHRSEIIAGARIGRGGFSHVYEIAEIRLSPEIDARLSAEDRQARRQLAAECIDEHGRPRFALKHLQESLLLSSDKQKFAYAASDLAVEAAFLSRLDHANIMSLRALPIGGLAALEEGGHDSFFLVLDRVSSTLDERIQEWKLEQRSNVEEKLDISLQLARALEYLHSRRLVFRDLKPHNIGLIDNKVVLFDFGLCRELPSSDRTGLYFMSGVGTRRYMAVEIINTSKYNCKADVYSWAMVVWEMLSLTRPFAHYSLEDHRVQVCQQGERPDLDLDVPDHVKNLLEVCWTESVSERFNMSEVVALLTAMRRSQECLEEIDDEGDAIMPVCNSVYDGFYQELCLATPIDEDLVPVPIYPMVKSKTCPPLSPRSIASIPHLPTVSTRSLTNSSCSDRSLSLLQSALLDEDIDEESSRRWLDHVAFTLPEEDEEMRDAPALEVISDEDWAAFDLPILPPRNLFATQAKALTA